MQHARKSLESLARLVIGDDPRTLAAEGQLEAGFVLLAAGKTALVCGLIIELVRVLHGAWPSLSAHLQEI